MTALADDDARAEDVAIQAALDIGAPRAPESAPYNISKFERAIYRAGIVQGMRRAAGKCDELAAELKPYSERYDNAEDMTATQCAAIIRAAADQLEGQQ